jgi:hypothetical protein
MQLIAPKEDDKRCQPKASENSIIFKRTPNDAWVDTPNWHKRALSGGKHGDTWAHDIEFLLVSDAGKVGKRNEITLHFEPAGELPVRCKVIVYVTNSVGDKSRLLELIGNSKLTADSFDQRSLATGPNKRSHSFDFRYQEIETADDTACLGDSGKTVRTIFYDIANDVVFFSTDLPINDWIAPSSRKVGLFERWLPKLVGSANADELKFGMPYPDLKAALDNTDPNTRVVGRHYMSSNFAPYAEPALSDLFNPNSTPELKTGLLHGLSAGIEDATNSKLSPGKARNLDEPLPYVDGRTDDILKLAGHENESVRKQARRLIQRYPVSDFLAPMQTVLEQSKSGNCNPLHVDNPDGVFAAIAFYEYNRTIDTVYRSAELSEDEIGSIDQTALKIKDAMAKCVSDLSVRTDAAVLDYGRALAYQATAEQRAKQAANDFLRYLEDQKGPYYFQQHVSRMKDLAF